MAGKLKKIIAVFSILLIVAVRLLAPVYVWADDITPAPTDTVAVTPTDTPTDTPAPTDTITPTPDSSVNSDSVTPTDTPTVDSGNTTQTNDSTTNNNVDSTANTGDNTSTQDASLASPTPTATDNSGSANSSSAPANASTIDTGDATAVTSGSSQVNTNSNNSSIIFQTINLFVNEDGDVDLSTPFAIAKSIVVDSNNNSPVINVAATSQTNYGYISNNVVSVADSGNNTEASDLKATINTGNATSVVSLINQINFNISGSTLHVITINIFGNFSGNIILPEFKSLESCTSCGMDIAQNNTAIVNNNVTSEANSGVNQATTGGDSSITTGRAESAVNLENLINTNIFGMLLFNLVINNFGNWSGNFLGWGDAVAAQSGGNGLIANYMSPNAGGDCGCLQNLSQFNYARVDNNVLSLANSGLNSAAGNDVTINTGKATSAVTIANFVNSNFISSVGFFGFINIFGNWTGSVGGASKFVAPTQAPDNAAAAGAPAQPHEDGGQLSVVNSNNVGAFVNPGDTVTFSVNTTNIGTGKVYGAKLDLYLVKDGQAMGGSTFNLGDIPVGKIVHLTTGFVLSKDAPGGIYTAVAKVHGVGGADDHGIDASANSTFMVSGGQELTTATISNPNIPPHLPKVLGAKTVVEKSATSQDAALAMLFVFFVGTYLAIRAVKKREYLAEVFSRTLTLKEKVYSLRLFLL